LHFYFLVGTELKSTKINYSSDKNYLNERLAVKYPSQTKVSINKESEKVAVVQTPMIPKRRQIYGALAEKK
jgi:hypothetical protein